MPNGAKASIIRGSERGSVPSEQSGLASRPSGMTQILDPLACGNRSLTVLERNSNVPRYDHYGRTAPSQVVGQLWRFPLPRARGSVALATADATGRTGAAQRAGPRRQVGVH